MMEKRIIEILEKVSLKEELMESKNFIEDGLIDSLGMVNVVAELEECFNIEIDWLDLAPEDFISVESIVKFVKRCKSNATVC